MTSNPIDTAIATIRAGGIIAIIDDGRASPDIDVVMAGELLTEDTMAKMRTLAETELYVPVSAQRLDELGINQQPPKSVDPLARRTAFTESIGLTNNTLSDTSDTSFVTVVQALASAEYHRDSFTSPGPVTAIRAGAGGVLRRLGHTEAAVDLAVLAGLTPVGVTARTPPSTQPPPHIPVVSISEIVSHRRANEKLVFRVSATRLPTEFGDFEAVAFHDTTTREDHLALTLGNVTAEPPPLVRVHSECLTGDALGSLRCDCGAQLRAAMAMIGAEGRGIVVYLRQEGRGIGLANKIRAYELQDGGLDTVDANTHLGFAADLRDFGVGAQMLSDLRITDLRLLTNNPKKTEGFQAYGLNVVEQLPLTITPSDHNRRYLDTKKQRMGHSL